MVAINDNFNNLTKIFDKKSSSGQSEELFAELFAIFNSEFSENIDNNLSEKLKKEMSSPVINLEENSQDILNKDGVIHQNVNQTEIDLAKDLINVFYKDFGIDITNLNKTKERNCSKT